MNITKLLSSILVLLVVSIGGFFWYNHSTVIRPEKTSTTDETTVPESSAHYIAEHNSSTKTAESIITDIEKTGSETTKLVVPKVELARTESHGFYGEYTPELVSSAKPDEIIVLFFRAFWCPTCNALHTDILQQKLKLPTNVSILFIDYDQNEDLKKRYDVTYQHTLIQVDNKGNEITKWSGGYLETILENIKQP